MRPPRYIGARSLIGTMTSADFSNRKPVQFEISLGKMNILVSMPATSTISTSLESYRTSVSCATSSDLIASYAISVRQYRHHSLAYFSVWITPNHLATCLASRHDPSAYGTYTLWNVSLLRLYSPFKAHTRAKMQMSNYFYSTFLQSVRKASPSDISKF